MNMSWSHCVWINLPTAGGIVRFWTGSYTERETTQQHIPSMSFTVIVAAEQLLMSAWPYASSSKCLILLENSLISVEGCTLYIKEVATNTVTKWHASVQWLIGLQWGVQSSWIRTQVQSWSTHPFLIGLPQLACNYLSTKSITRMVVYVLLVCDTTYAAQAFQCCMDWQHCNSFVK